MARKRKKKSDFGEYLTQLIKDAGMSQSDFYCTVGITKPYFYDIVSGRLTAPPRETLERMIGVLEQHLPPDENRHIEFLKYAAISRGEIPCDISEIILGHPDSWDDIRTVLQTMFASQN